MWSMFNHFVKSRTQDNFKFWIVSLIKLFLLTDFPSLCFFLNDRLILILNAHNSCEGTGHK